MRLAQASEEQAPRVLIPIKSLTKRSIKHPCVHSIQWIVQQFDHRRHNFYYVYEPVILSSKTNLIS